MNFFTNLSTPKHDSLACCACRIVAPKEEQSSAHYACQNCGQTMYNMGAGFIPPHQSDKDQWQKVSFLVKHNFTFEYLSA
jgi:hypothetical protein